LTVDRQSTRDIIFSILNVSIGPEFLTNQMWVERILGFLDRFKYGTRGLFRKLLLHSWTIVFTILCSGIIHGWPFLFMILIKQGYFAELCVITNAITDERDCLPQYLKISQIFVLGITILYISYFQGILSDWLPRFHLFLSSVLVVGGFLFIGLVNDTIFYGIDHYIPGMCMLAIGGYGIHVNYIKMSGMYAHGDRSIRAHLFGAQECSSLVFLIFYIMEDHIHIREFCKWYSIVPAISAILTIFFPSHRKMQIKGNIQSQDDLVYDSDRIINKFLEEVEQEDLTEQQLKWKIISPDFILIIIFSVIHSFFMNFYILSLVLRINEPFYVELFGWIFQLSFIISPISGWMLETFKISKLLVVVQILAIVFSGLLFIPAMWGQIVCFFIYVAYRSLFSNVIFEYILVHAEFPNYNKFYSVLGVVQGTFQLGLYPLLFVKSFVIINSIQVGIIVLSSIIPAIILWRKRKVVLE
jgi:hypothetical protein